jgi:hypothetical protein
MVSFRDAKYLTESTRRPFVCPSHTAAGGSILVQRWQPSLRGHLLKRICYALAGLAKAEPLLLTFLSQGWRSLIRPSLSHFTSASSSFVCSTVPNSPVGFPKLANPSTRSPGFSSESGAGCTSGGRLARSASEGAPACDRGGCGDLRSFGVGLLIWLTFHFPIGLFAS